MNNSKTPLHRKVRDAMTGPGGWHCPCCMSSDRKQRKQYLQSVRRKFTRLLERIERVENSDE